MFHRKFSKCDTTLRTLCPTIGHFPSYIYITNTQLPEFGTCTFWSQSSPTVSFWKNKHKPEPKNLTLPTACKEKHTKKKHLNPPFSINVAHLLLQPQRHSIDAIIKFEMPRWCFYLSWILKLDQWKVRYETIIKSWTDTATEESSFFDRRRTAPATAHHHVWNESHLFFLTLIPIKNIYWRTIIT